MENDFKECSECASKPGMPTLCESCLHNRTLIERLKMQLKFTNWTVDAYMKLASHLWPVVRLLVANMEREANEKKET